MDINYWAVLVCGLISMVVGFIWYGPIFKKKWAEVIGVDLNDAQAQERMKKSGAVLSLTQFLLTIFQIWVLARIIGGSPDSLNESLWIWAGFVVPIIAGGSMWNNDSRRIAWMRFLIQSGYQLVMFIIFGIILGIWR